MVKHALAQLYTDAKREGWAQYIRKGPGQEADEHAMLNGCKINLQTAKRWQNLFEKGLTKPQGEPFQLIDWQRDQVVIPLFGWTRPNGLRRYSKGAIWTAKKNGKTTIIGGLINASLYELPPNSRLYATAYSREQAKTLYDQAAAITRESKLGKLFRIHESQYTIKYKRKHNYFKVVPGEAGAHGLDGLISAVSIIDEIHEHKKREVYDRLNYSIAASPNGLVLSISTVGVEKEDLIWLEQYRYTNRILNGEIFDDAFFCFLAQADRECLTDAELRRDPEQWKKANPSMGVTISEDTIRGQLIEAENEPLKMYNFLQRVLNIPTGSVVQAIDMEAWKECKAEKLPDLKGRRAFAALDLASTEDLNAFVIYFPPVNAEDKGVLLTRFWAPWDKMIQREQANKVQYREFWRKEHLRVTDGNVVDYEQILLDILEDVAKYDIELIGYDKHNAEFLMQKVGLHTEVVSIPQGIFTMTLGTKAFLKAVSAKEFIHDGNEVMEWCCANAMLERRSGGQYVKFNKDKSADKIDGAVAASMAFHLAAIAEPKKDVEFDPSMISG